MKEYEIVYTYLNGCAGAAYPLRSFEEAELNDPMDYLRKKHPVEFSRFIQEIGPEGQLVYTFKGDAVTYIYEFNEL
jgi:hypothetical protein